MTISGRMPASILQGGLVAAMCLGSAATLWAQGRTPANPLRQPQGVAEKLAGPALVPPQLEKPTPPPSSQDASRNNARTVRRASYGMPVAGPRVINRATSYAFPAERANGPSVLTQPPEALATPEPKSAAGRTPVEGEIIYEGVFEGVPGDAAMFESGEIIGSELGDCIDGTCCDPCLAAPCGTIGFNNFELFAGVEGFTGPLNRGGTGSFGFHEGFNWGFPLPICNGALGAQVGLRTVQANLSGAEFTDENRNQLFVTGGLFRRVDWGMQAGVVVDYLSQDWYSDTDLLQIRGEASWVFPCMHELGFWFTAGTNTSEVESELINQRILESWEPTDLYAFFYRRRFTEGIAIAEARGFAGFSGQGDGFLGADVHLPLGTNWALDTGFAYLVPEEATGTAGGGHVEESWNVGVTLVWYPGCGSICGTNYFRPLLNVADNGSFMLDAR